MHISRNDILFLFLATFSLIVAWQIDVILPQRIVVAPLYLVPILIVASRFKTRMIIIFTIFAICLITYEQITEQQDYLTIIFDNVGITIASYLAIRLTLQRINAEKLKELSEDTKKQLEILMHVVLHDIKQPLTVANLSVKTLYKASKGSNRVIITKINDALESITMLTSDLGDTARIARGELILNRSQIALSDLLQEVIAEQQLTTNKHKIKLISQKNVQGTWDKERLKRVFVNLISNAIKYSPEGGEILVRATKKNQKAYITIKDSGIGMTRQEADSLFQPFVRQYEGKQKIKGTGLGLYICKTLITAHNGKIWVTSRKGKGSTFFVQLPLTHY